MSGARLAEAMRSEARRVFGLSERERGERAERGERGER